MQIVLPSSPSGTMRRQFVSNLTLLLLVNGLVKPLWIFGIDLTVQNRVGTEAYGLYASVFSFSLILNIILDLGLSHFSNRNMAQNPERLTRNFSRLTTLKLFLALVYFLIALILGGFLGFWHQSFALMLLLCLNQFFLSLIVFFRAHLAGLHRFKADALMSVLDKALMVLLCGTALYASFWPWPMTVLQFAALQSLCLLLAVALGFVLVFRQTRLFTLRLNWSEFGSRLRESLPYAVLILLMAFYTRVDSIMLQQIAGESAAGIYAQAFRLLDALNQPAYLFSVLLLPMFAGMLSRQESVGELSQLAFTLVVVFTAALSLASALNAPGLMHLLYQDQPDRAVPIFRTLIFSSVGFGVTYIYGTLLTAGGQLKLLNRVALGGFGANIVLNFGLIPYYGAAGAAWATVFTQSFTALLQLGLCYRLQKLAYPRVYWLRLLGFLVLLVGGGILFNAFAGWAWAWRWFALLLYAGILAAALRLLPWRSALDLIRARLAR